LNLIIANVKIRKNVVCFKLSSLFFVKPRQIKKR
jgi:hypothetical protein